MNSIASKVSQADKILSETELSLFANINNAAKIPCENPIQAIMFKLSILKQ